MSKWKTTRLRLCLELVLAVASAIGVRAAHANAAHATSQTEDADAHWIVNAATNHASSFLYGGNEETSFAVIGDAGQWNENTQQVRNSILKTPIRDLILPGDNLYVPIYSYEHVWKPWTETGFRFFASAIGNHHGGYDKEIRFFDMPGEYFSLVSGPDTRFIVLNSDNKKNVKEQVKWAEQELSQAQEKLIFLIYHHPSLTVSRTHDWKEREKFQRAIRALIKAYRSRITAILNGHDHLATLVHFDNLPVFVSGATHEARMGENLDETQEGMRVKTAWLFDGHPHWLRLDLYPKAPRGPEAIFHFIRAKDHQLACSMRIRTGYPAELGSNCQQNRQGQR